MGHVHIIKRKFHFSESSHKFPIPPSGKYFAPNSSSQLQGVRIKTQFAIRYKKVNVYLPSLMMKVPNHLYVLGDTYTCHT
jgi:hypothetical protein